MMNYIHQHKMMASKAGGSILKMYLERVIVDGLCGFLSLLVINERSYSIDALNGTAARPNDFFCGF